MFPEPFDSYLMNPSLHSWKTRSFIPRGEKLLLLVLINLACLESGCDWLTSSINKRSPTNAPIPVQLETSNRVAAQGRFLPETGIIRLSATPGDRIEALLVKVGDTVEAGQELVQLASHRLRKIELEIAQRKFKEAESQAESRRIEADMAIESAASRVTSAQLLVSQAQSQLALVESSKSTLEQLRTQISKMESLRSDPLTRNLVSEVELTQKQIDYEQQENRFKQSLLAAQQNIDSAKLAQKTAIEAHNAAKRNRELVDSAVPLQSTRQQIELLELQLKQSLFVAPQAGQVLSISSQTGETVGPTPVLEMADLSSMVCWAEVQEADASRIAIGDSAEITSAALPRPLKGEVYRIDAMVGSPQMRNPNPLAKTDFRAVPVWIRIQSDDVVLAARYVQMQVDVTILVEKTPPAIEP